jgi:hypothetical protein
MTLNIIDPTVPSGSNSYRIDQQAKWSVVEKADRLALKISELAEEIQGIEEFLQTSGEMSPSIKEFVVRMNPIFGLSQDELQNKKKELCELQKKLDGCNSYRTFLVKKDEISAIKGHIVFLDRKIKAIDEELSTLKSSLIRRIYNYIMGIKPPISKKQEALETLRETNLNHLNLKKRSYAVLCGQINSIMIPRKFQEVEFLFTTDFKPHVYDAMPYEPGKIPKAAPRAVTPLVFTHNDRARKLFERAMSSPVIKDLYIAAMLTPNPYTGSVGPWDLDYDKEATFGAYIKQASRIIRIDPSKTDDEALKSFVFELTNAVRSRSFAMIARLAIAGKMDRETYARLHELVEYEGAKKAHLILKAAIQEMGWNRSMNGYRWALQFSGFEEYWNAIKNDRHADAYRQQYDQIRLLG